MKLKPGTYHRLAHRDSRVGEPGAYSWAGESTSEEWARKDALTDVAKDGGPNLVYIVKVIAVARRSASLEE